TTIASAIGSVEAATDATLSNAPHVNQWLVAAVAALGALCLLLCAALVLQCVALLRARDAWPRRRRWSCCAALCAALCPSPLVQLLHTRHV
ncbi:hypothetical protein NL533_31310, partial [Klebsiella pneumoniae]|nr:hypothetical protein [Klebsiella pneumoniae]